MIEEGLVALSRDEHKAADCLGITPTIYHRTIRKIAGFPYYTFDFYLPKLIRAGHRIAICGQLEVPKARAKSPKCLHQMEVLNKYFLNLLVARGFNAQG